MKKQLLLFITLTFVLASAVAAQIKPAVQVEILKAEDARRFDKTLENLMKSPDAKIRERAALAAGRIGKDAAIPAISLLLSPKEDSKVRAMAAFALGEIESIMATDALLVVLNDTRDDQDVRARAVEAAGKIVAANGKDPKSELLRKAIVSNLEFESGRRSMPSREVILMGITAVLRARPENGAEATAKFLGYSDARIRSDAANTLTRLRAKNANPELRKMLESDTDAVARANAARALGAAEDKESLPLLLNVLVKDPDSRVRVSTINSIAALKDKSAVTPLLQHAAKLVSSIKQPTNSKTQRSILPAEKNELLIIASALGRLAAGTKDENVLGFFNSVRQIDRASSGETEIAFARVAPTQFVESVAGLGESLFEEDWRTMSAVFQGLGEIASLEESPENDALKSLTRIHLVQLIAMWLNGEPGKPRPEAQKMAIPDLLRAFAAFKSDNTAALFIPILEIENDIYIRATVAEVLGDQKPTKDITDALNKAFIRSMLTDKTANDATLAYLDALYKLDKKESSGSLLMALTMSDYLVRKKALEMLADPEVQKDKPGIPTMIESALKNKKDELSDFAVTSKLGALLNTKLDYVRAASRKNGTVKAILTTDKGAFTINFNPEEAPLTVANFIKLARSGYFNGKMVHRVVPNFVMQDGDPRGDGNGGPGWDIRCEVNMLPYDRGAVGMALSGKDTGGSQWFVTHSPQPHLDGGYTVFGHVSELDMKIVDSIVRGDRILSVRVVETFARRK